MRSLVRVEKLMLAVVFTTSVGALAMLCRGHVPDRNDTANLPAWETILPPSPDPAVTSRASALPNRSIIYGSATAINLLYKQADRLGTQLDRATSGEIKPELLRQAADWLISSSAEQNLPTPYLNARSDIASKLISLAGPDGWYVSDDARSSVTGMRDNLQATVTNALCIYYASTHSPSAIYAAIRSAECLAREDANPKSHPVQDDSDLVEAMTRLYMMTSDRRYLVQAQLGVERSRVTGTGWLELYSACGDEAYLHAAIHSFQESINKCRTDNRLGYGLFQLTASPHFLNCISAYASSNPWAYAAQAARVNGHIQVCSATPQNLVFAGWTLTEKVHGTSTTVKMVRNATSSADESIVFYSPNASRQRGSRSTITVFAGKSEARCVKDLKQLSLSGKWKHGDSIVIKQS